MSKEQCAETFLHDNDVLQCYKVENHNHNHTTSDSYTLIEGKISKEISIVVTWSIKETEQT